MNSISVHQCYFTTSMLYCKIVFYNLNRIVVNTFSHIMCIPYQLVNPIFKANSILFKYLFAKDISNSHRYTFCIINSIANSYLNMGGIWKYIRDNIRTNNLANSCSRIITSNTESIKIACLGNVRRDAILSIQIPCIRGIIKLSGRRPVKFSASA